MSTTMSATEPHAAVIWVDGWHAIVARSEHGRRVITEVVRDADPEPLYLLRVARQADDCDRVMILGPDQTRLAFEREYVALYRRPDRLVDIEAAPSAKTVELLDRLRWLDGVQRPS